MNQCCLKNIYLACEASQREIATLKAEQAQHVTSEDADEAMMYLAQILKARKGNEHEWMPTQAVYRAARALLVKVGRL